MMHIAASDSTSSGGAESNVELLAPVAAAVAGATGKQIEALCLLSEAAKARPEYRELQENVEILAAGAGQLNVALEANLR